MLIQLENDLCDSFGELLGFYSNSCIYMKQQQPNMQACMDHYFFAEQNLIA